LITCGSQPSALAHGLQLGEDYDVVQVLVLGCVVGATTGDQSQSGMVDLTVQVSGNAYLIAGRSALDFAGANRLSLRVWLQDLERGSPAQRQGRPQPVKL
jgi:hypothetical protein